MLNNNIIVTSILQVLSGKNDKEYVQNENYHKLSLISLI